ncbi:hypothetical protein AXK57_03905 [Tsukamurella pulmonis]|uniref:hypothetical protein n=2 Tax=Tsukamurella pulmonis TaxID=47312 RepID=UPI0007990A4F|nr:hypothetical protein [Tsukamurella pulmonis]KXP13354.1 hypothetical protein AXK57_03905 [Tsukamurella pulmonis]
MTDDAKPEGTEPDETAPKSDESATDPKQAGKRRPVARGTSLRRPATDAPPAGGDADAGETASASAAAGPDADAPSAPEKKIDLGKRSAEEPSSAPTDTEQSPSKGSSLRLPIAIAAAAVVIGAAAATVAIARPGAAAVDNRAFVDTGLTTEVVSVSKQAATQIYTIDMNDLGPWEKDLGKVLTPGMIDEAKKLRTAITQTAGALQDVKVKVDDGDLTAGVSLAREDHAEVLLNVRQQVSTQGVPVATMQSPMKFVLDRFDGAWKVSSITPL